LLINLSQFVEIKKANENLSPLIFFSEEFESLPAYLSTRSPVQEIINQYIHSYAAFKILFFHCRLLLHKRIFATFDNTTFGSSTKASPGSSLEKLVL